MGSSPKRITKIKGKLLILQRLFFFYIQTHTDAVKDVEPNTNMGVIPTKTDNEYMRKILACLLAVFGMTSACGQKNHENVAVNASAAQSTTADSYELDVFKTKSGKEVKFHALVHASIRIEYDGKDIEVDPVSKMGNKVINYAAMPKADYLFVTHEHGDHFDKEAIKVLTGEKTRFITNKRCADMYGSGDIMANGDVLKLADDITVKAVPAYNNTEGHLQFHPKGRDNGYILTIDELRIYIAGDTEDIPEMADIKDIDIAFMPCNQPYTMTPEQLVKAAKVVKPKVLFPYHYGQTDVSGIPALLKDDGIDVRIRHYE